MKKTLFFALLITLNCHLFSQENFRFLQIENVKFDSLNKDTLVLRFTLNEFDRLNIRNIGTVVFNKQDTIPLNCQILHSDKSMTQFYENYILQLNESGNLVIQLISSEGLILQSFRSELMHHGSYFIQLKKLEKNKKYILSIIHNNSFKIIKFNG